MVATRAGKLAEPSPRARRAGCFVERLECRAMLSHGADGLAAWFRADAIGVVSGAPVTSWADSSGHGRSATQSMAVRRPTFQAEGLNGRPSVRFDAAATTQLSFARPVSGDFTLVVVFGSTQGLG